MWKRSSDVLTEAEVEAIEAEHDRLAALFRDNPEQYEKERRAILDAEIARMELEIGSEQANRLRAVLWRLEQDLNRYQNPIARFNEVVSRLIARCSRRSKFTLAVAELVEAGKDLEHHTHALSVSIEGLQATAAPSIEGSTT